MLRQNLAEILCANVHPKRTVIQNTLNPMDKTLFLSHNCLKIAWFIELFFLCFNTSGIQRMAIAHFLILVNYGTLIKLDFNDGEIRYQTSINVEGDPLELGVANRLTPALIKRLVYTNVAMMDEYLPGIRAVIEQEKAQLL